MIQQHAVEITSQSSTYRVNIIITTTQNCTKEREKQALTIFRHDFFLCAFLRLEYYFFFVVLRELETTQKKEGRNETKPEHELSYKM